ncbi:MAG: hypothetical protein LBU37_07765 [Tannerellaceae bacterium]|jgi:hypothetical protein|nr:hypothetical protein [Tannerellaceae bacterium]
MESTYNVFFGKLLLTAVLCCYSAGVSQAKNKRDGNSHATNVLMLGLNDNVRSNYFPKVMITEETGITEDRIDEEYNTIIMDNIMAANNGACKFIPASVTVETSAHKWAGLIKVNGEGDECYSDLTPVPADEYRKTLDMAEAEYLLAINQHYLKWQETPMHTLFYIVSYTLFDKDKNEIYRGSSYFTSMNLERPEKLRKISGKTSSRIAASVINQLK